MSNSYFDTGRMMDRREFVKVTSAVAAGTMLVGWLPKGAKAVEKYPHWGEVLVVRNDAATDGPNIRAEEVQGMMDESIRQLTGQSSVADAWSSLLPGWKEDHVIAIKVNTVSSALATHPQVADAIVAGLTEMGVPENNIIVYDKLVGSGLVRCGYTYNKGPVGVRCFTNEEEGWGYDWDHPVDIRHQQRALSTIVTRCDHLINVPVLKIHAMGATLSMKNHYGSVDSPSSLHTDWRAVCVELNAQEAIRNKTRLVVIDALFGCSYSSSALRADFAPNSLIVSTDPIASEVVGTEMLNEERARRGKAPSRRADLGKAAEMGLGAPAKEVQKIPMYIGAQVGVVCALSAGTVPRGIIAGQSTPVEVRVVLDASRETTGSPPQMSLDLSSLGISSELPLHHAGGARYTASTTVPPLQNGRYPLPVMLETGKEERIRVATAAVNVYPAEDLSIYEDEPGEGWTVEVTRGESDLMSSTFVHSGSFSHAIAGHARLPMNVEYVFDDPEGIAPFGYSLELWINGGETSGQDPIVGGKKLSDLGIVPQSNTWTRVSIPVSELPLDTSGRLTGILISGVVKETFYLDDMKLVAQEPPEPETAVEVSEGKALPSDYSLSQNVPNPFNARTTIPYTLPKAGPVQLVVYNASGQRIRRLVNGHQQAGSYGVIWDGKDEAGRDAASGVYVAWLASEGRVVQTRRMTLLR